MSHSHTIKHNKPGARQVHHNREKFNPYRHKDENDKVHVSVLDTMTSLCCKRCCDIIQWKVDFGKYLHLERPRRCNGCSEKTVAISYHHICQECAKKAIVCAKCQKPPKFEMMASEAGKRVEDSDEESEEQEEGGEAVKKSLPESLLKYTFVDEVVSDEEFAAYRGLDVRRLVQYKRRVQAMLEREKRGNLRERERRTVLRKLKKAEGGDVGEEVDFDSDEEM
jgi:hypothetical protein